MSTKIKLELSPAEFQALFNTACIGVVVLRDTGSAQFETLKAAADVSLQKLGRTGWNDLFERMKKLGEQQPGGLVITDISPKPH